MGVSGIFKTLIIIVACVLIGAMVLNVFLPNVVTSLSNAVEGSIYNATGMSFDLNGDGTAGKANGESTKTGQTINGAGASTNNNTAGQQENTAGSVEGFN